VYDGTSVDDPELGTFCGSSLPDPPVIRSTSNQLFIRLKADGSHAGRGFKANFTSVNLSRNIKIFPNTCK
jgi:CUB domain